MQNETEFRNFMNSKTLISNATFLTIILLLFCLHLSITAVAQETNESAAPNQDWRPVGLLDKKIDESSGIVKSPVYDQVYWTHNDSGGKPVIFAVKSSGELIRKIIVENAQNVDWEDITFDEKGRLVIADAGNNYSERKDLKLYVIDEPNPYESKKAQVIETINFKYPNQEKFPDPEKKFDCEALFQHKGKIKLLTKRRNDLKTRLFTFPESESEAEVILEPGPLFDAGSLVTAADMSPDGKRLVILSYEFIDIFTEKEDAENLFDYDHHRLLIEGKQCEAVTWDNEDIIFTNEQGEIHRLEKAFWTNNSEYLPPIPETDVHRIENFKADGKKDEWKADSDSLQLKIKKESQKDRPPAVFLGWNSDALLIYAEWNLKVKKLEEFGGRKSLAFIMIDGKEKRPPHLSPEQIVFEICLKDKEPVVQIPFKPDEKLETELFFDQGKGKTVMEAAVPAKLVPSWNHEKGNRFGLNILLITNQEAREWHWSTDSDCMTWDNPFTWGKAKLTDEAE